MPGCSQATVSRVFRRTRPLLAQLTTTQAVQLSTALAIFRWVGAVEAAGVADELDAIGRPVSRDGTAYG